MIPFDLLLQAYIATVELAQLVNEKEGEEHRKARERIGIIVMNALADLLERPKGQPS